MTLNVDYNVINELKLEDLPNEKWVEAFGFEDTHQVSNLGRVKRLEYEVASRWGTPILLKEMILKQTINLHKSGRIDGCKITLSKIGHSAKIFYQSFYPEEDFKKNECVMHVNKNSLDNRIENLQKVSIKVSKLTDFQKSKRTKISALINITKANQVNKVLHKNKSKTHKKCFTCGKVDIIENFPKNVRRCQKCINQQAIDRRKRYEYKNEEKQCKRCKETKLDIEFPRLDNTCKKCRNELHKEYMQKYKSKKSKL